MNTGNSPWTIQFGRLGKVAVYLHLTVPLVLLWSGLVEYEQRGSAFDEILFAFLAIISLIVHELGHVVAARQLGISTNSSTLLPFGGTQILSREPSPRESILIALAGPFSSFILVLILVPLSPSMFAGAPYAEAPLAARLLLFNALLVLVNSIPAWPLDGGRVLRDVFELFGFENSLVLAVRIGQILALTAGIYGILAAAPLIVLIAGLIFFTAMTTLLYERAREAGKELLVRDVMVGKERFRCFSHGTPLEDALEEVLRSFQNFFPILHGVDVLGLAAREDIIRATALGAEDYISRVMIRDIPRVTETETVHAVLSRYQDGDALPLLAFNEQNEFVGMVLKEQLFEYLLVRDVQTRRAAELSYDDDFS